MVLAAQTFVAPGCCALKAAASCVHKPPNHSTYQRSLLKLPGLKAVSNPWQLVRTTTRSAARKLRRVRHLFTAPQLGVLEDEPQELRQ